jgi:anti-anti-sigma factor
MTTENLTSPPSLHVREETDGVVHVAGELDLATAPQLQAVLHRLVSSGADTVVLDVADLSFCDSIGLGVFVAAHRDLPAGLVIRHPSIPLQKLLHATALDTHFNLA